VQQQINVTLPQLLLMLLLQLCGSSGFCIVVCWQLADVKWHEAQAIILRQQRQQACRCQLLLTRSFHDIAHHKHCRALLLLLFAGWTARLCCCCSQDVSPVVLHNGLHDLIAAGSTVASLCQRKHGVNTKTTQI
jgi:hypothetical protein